MKKSVLATFAISLSSIAGSALAADLPVRAPLEAPMPAFSWTSCYFGMHVGGGFAHKNVTDPVQLPQDTIAGAGTTTGATTASINPSGAVVGAQLGCDYQFDPHWVIGVEGAVSGSTMKGNTTVGLPAGIAGDQGTFGVTTDFMPSVTARIGYAFDRLLFYGKGGVAFASDKYTETGSFAGTPFSFSGLDFRTGWTAGVGAEWAFSRHWGASLEYDYYSFGNKNILMTDAVNGSGIVNVSQTVQIVKVGLNFHMW
jgi:opacity protein-like surface antigen